MNDPRRILARALISEKGTQLREKSNQYVFRVAPDANKIDIKRAVESIFSVRVTEVRTMVFQGKKKRVGFHIGRRASWKKAVVTLAKGQTIEMFEQI
jgi:large subunit ribosomal protein L23